jgi:hypothetical protein
MFVVAPFTLLPVIGFVAVCSLADERVQEQARHEQPSHAEDDMARELKALKGGWRAVAAETDGKNTPPGVDWTFTDAQVRVTDTVGLDEPQT